MWQKRSSGRLTAPSRRPYAAVLAAWLAAAANALAAPVDEPELVTDRPDQTESTAIVPAGRVQIELGASIARDDLGDDADEVEIEVRQLAGTLVRVGLGDRFELRLGWEGWLDEEVTTAPHRASHDGPGDAVVGAKVGLRQGGGTSPAVAVLVHTSVPVADETFSTDRFDPSFRVSVSHDLSGRVGLGYNAGVRTESRPAPDGDYTTLASAIYTLSVSVAAGERAKFFVEVFGEVAMSAKGGPAHLVDGGATYLVRPNVQLDVAAGAGLSDDTPDWFAGIGVSVRWPR